MGLAKLSKVTMLVPRKDLDITLRNISEFEWFHPSPIESAFSDPKMEDIGGKSFKLFAELDELTTSLGVQLEPGVIEILKKGYNIVQEERNAEDWSDFIHKVEKEARPIISNLRNTVDSTNNLKKNVSDDKSLKAALLMLSNYSINLESINRFNRIHAVFAIATSKDVNEIRKSLPDEVLIESYLTKVESAILLIGPKSESDRINKALRSFEVRPFSIPIDLPQNPAKAYQVVNKRLIELEEELSRKLNELKTISTENSPKLLSLRESSLIAYKVTGAIKKTGDLKRFAIIQGYIPKNQEADFYSKCNLGITFSEEPNGQEETPSLLTNKGAIKSFQNITLTQGPPMQGETDPTPLITFVFPIFYGMMFGDFGQGMLLFLLGTLLKIRGSPALKSWGTILMAAGGAAAIMGLLVGEAFGIHLGTLSGVGEFFSQIQILKLTEHGQFNQETVTILLTTSIVIGVIHITIGLILDIVKGLREKSKLALLTLKIPSLILYIFGVGFSMSFIAAGFSFEALWSSTNRVPLISDIVGYPIAANSLAMITLPIAILGAGWIIIGKPIEGILDKNHKEKESPFMALIFGVVEFLLRMVEFLANTISYARLGILLLVHAALMFTVSMTLSSGPAMLPLWIVGNLGVMALEGLIVYIQDIRLHLYEWFTKFYEGTGMSFTKIVPQTMYIKIKWQHGK